MKIVVYTSSTGFTKTYAEWIAQRLGCEAKPLKKVKNINDYDTVIYGGWILGNMIMGLKNLQKNYSGKLVLFGVGFTDPSETVLENIKNQNQLGSIPVFYMLGGCHYEKLGFMKKMMLKMVKNSIIKKENRSDEEEKMMNLLGTSFDHSDKKYIEPLIEYVQQ